MFTRAQTPCFILLVFGLIMLPAPLVAQEKPVTQTEGPTLEPLPESTIQFGTGVLFGLMGGALLGFAGGLTAFIVGDCSFVGNSDPACDTLPLVGTGVGMSLGAAVGATFSVQSVGKINGSSGKLISTFTGGVLGASVGAGIFAWSVAGSGEDRPALFPLLVLAPLGSALGATLGYQHSSRLQRASKNMSFQLSPTRQGGMAHIQLRF